LEVRIRHIRAKCPVNRQRKYLGVRSHSSKVRIRGRSWNILRWNLRTIISRAGDCSGDVCPVSVGINQCQRKVCRHSTEQIGVRLVNSSIIHIDSNTSAPQSTEIWRGSQTVGRHGHSHAREIIGHSARQHSFNDLNARQSRQRHQCAFRRTHHQLPSERRTFLAQHHRFHPGQLTQHRLAFARKQQQIQSRVRGQRRLLDRNFQQRRIDLVIRLPRQHRLSRRQRAQLPGHSFIRANQIGVIGNVGDDLSAGLLQRRTEGFRSPDHATGPRNCPGRLPPADAPNVQVQWSARINQRIAQDQAARGSAQLIHRHRRVGQPVGKRRLADLSRRIGLRWSDRSTGVEEPEVASAAGELVAALAASRAARSRANLRSPSCQKTAAATKNSRLMTNQVRVLRFITY
jgi:hypothetical protein